jgi:hypothetical protein
MLDLTASFISEEFARPAVSGLSLLHVNHDLEDVHVLTELLRQSGLDVTYVPVSYSGGGYEPDKVRQKIERWLSAHAGRELAVLEDGGHYVRQSSPRVLLSIEQTTFGIRRAQRSHGMAAVISVSSCAVNLAVDVEDAYRAHCPFGSDSRGVVRIACHGWSTVAWDERGGARIRYTGESARPVVLQTLSADLFYGKIKPSRRIFVELAGYRSFHNPGCFFHPNEGEQPCFYHHLGNRLFAPWSLAA